MSPDEIVFDDLKYREPERRRRPDRDRRWACLAYEVPGPNDLPIFLDRLTADAIERHALSDTRVELGGILLGKECLDDQTGLPFVWVTKSLEAKHFENTQASFTYTHDSWEEITRERDRLHADLDIVGWYHTHPDFGVFLSSHDLFIHQHFFAQPLQVAYVVDPIRQTRGFFQWREGTLAQVGGFHLSADRSDRATLARLVNDLENIPNTEGGGGGISPRLEAELIAMLTRPATHNHATAADRTQTAALFSMLGVLAGVLGFAAVLWMNSLNNRVEEQTAVLKDLGTVINQTTSAQRLALNALVNGASKGDPDRFVEEYAKAARDRDEARSQLRNQATINDALAVRAKEFQLRNTSLAADLEAATKKATRYEKDAIAASELREKLDELDDQTRRQAAELTEQKELLATTNTRKAAALLNKYQRVWYIAAAGWSLVVLLALGLVAVLASQKPNPDESAPPAPAAPPPHRIT